MFFQAFFLTCVITSNFLSDYASAFEISEHWSVILDEDSPLVSNSDPYIARMNWENMGRNHPSIQGRPILSPIKIKEKQRIYNPAYNIPSENKLQKISVERRNSTDKLYDKRIESIMSKPRYLAPTGMNDNLLKRPRERCILSPGTNRRKCLKRTGRRKLKNVPLNISDFTRRSNYSGEKYSIFPNMSVENQIRDSIAGRRFNGNIDSTTISRAIGHRVKDSSFHQGQMLESNPCICYWTVEKCGCDCKGSLNYNDFMNLSRTFRPCHNFTFTMTGGQHYALPPNLFSKLDIVHNLQLSIHNSSFEYFCDPTPMTSPFMGVTFTNSALLQLKNISVRRGWNWTPLEHLKGTPGARADIVIEDCVLRRLASDFSNFASEQVQNIDIANSRLAMVGSAAFESFVNMEHFRVPDNKINFLRRTDFPKDPLKLVEIDLRNNQLQNLEDDLFDAMPSLKEISLAGNPLKVLQEMTFHEVISRVNLRGVSEFPLICDCHLQWLKESMLNGNEVAKKNLQGATCRRPAYLRGTPLDYLSKEHLRC